MWNGRVRGFTYLGLMIFIAIAGVAMAGIGSLASVQLQREKEAQLLFAGEQFRRAIESYYQSTPSAVKTFPADLQELLEDNRFPQPQRHLRQIYYDPMTGKREWGLVKLGGRVMGIYSLSAQKPRKKAGFTEQQADFSRARTYRDWQFTYLDPAGAFARAQTGSSQPSKP